VDTELPSGGYTGYSDDIESDLGTQALWVALAEKAYAVANGLGYVSSSNEYQDCYNALNLWYPEEALQAITGKSAFEYSINPTNIASAWNAGKLIVLSTGKETDPIVSDHDYAVVGYYAASSQPFELFNPWGTNSLRWAAPPGDIGKDYGLFMASAAFVSQNFTRQTFGTGASNVDDLAAPANGFTESAAVGAGYATSGTIDLTRYRPSGRAVGAATVAGHHGHKMAMSSTRPAQGQAVGTDLWGACAAADLAEQMVVSGTSPTLATTRSHNRTSGMGA
jgi:hypothetical protein